MNGPQDDHVDEGPEQPDPEWDAYVEWMDAHPLARAAAWENAGEPDA